MMVSVITKLLTPPEFADRAQARHVHTLHSILLAGLFGLTALLVTIVLFPTDPGMLIIGVALWLAFFAAWISLRRGSLRLSGVIVSATLLTLVFIQTQRRGFGLRDISILAFPLVITLGSLFLGKRAAPILTLVSMFIATFVYVGQTAGWFGTHAAGAVVAQDLLAVLIYIGVSGVALRLLMRDLTANAERAAASEAEIRQLNAELEARVARRARDLQTVTEIAHKITMELDVQRLQRSVAEYTAAAFDLYYVAVVLPDSELSTFTLSECAGSAEAISDLREHPVSFAVATEVSLVAEAIRRREPISSPDVNADPRYRFEPRLPKTQAELVLPMLLGGRLIGVLDFQSEHARRFTPDDARTLQSLADQVAVAVSNAQLFRQQMAIVDQLRDVDRLKTQFLATMSHELRTPLNSVINFGEFLTRGILGDLTGEQHEAAQNIVDSGRYLLKLINDILDISKIEAGALQLYIEDDLDLAAELRGARQTAQTLLTGKPVEAALEMIEPLPLVRGDRVRIRQILLNLVSNACKFTEQGSVTIRAWREEDQMYLSVEDTGPGIAPDEQAHLFETFHQTSTGLQYGKGTGLGLAIARRLAEAHHGSLEVESFPGHGTTFTFVMPVRSDQLVPANAAKE